MNTLLCFNKNTIKARLMKSKNYFVQELRNLKKLTIFTHCCIVAFRSSVSMNIVQYIEL